MSESDVATAGDSRTFWVEKRRTRRKMYVEARNPASMVISNAIFIRLLRATIGDHELVF